MFIPQVWSVQSRLLICKMEVVVHHWQECQPHLVDMNVRVVVLVVVVAKVEVEGHWQGDEKSPPPGRTSPASSRVLGCWNRCDCCRGIHGMQQTSAFPKWGLRGKYILIYYFNLLFMYFVFYFNTLFYFTSKLSTLVLLMITQNLKYFFSSQICQTNM